MVEPAISETENNQQFLVEASQKLIPWWTVCDKDVLKVQTEDNFRSYLDSYYFFPLNELSINGNCEDIPRFINERFHNILAAASHSGFSIALVLSSKKGDSKVLLGFKAESSSDNAPELFESIVNGVLPGKNIKFDETINFSSLADGYHHGGMVTGVPILKNNDEKQKFNLASVVRSLYGKEYFLAIISNPVPEIEKQKTFYELIQIRDTLHTLARQTAGEEKGFGDSYTVNNSHTTGESKTSGHSLGLGGMAGGGIALGNSGNLGLSYILNAGIGSFNALNYLGGVMPSYSRSISNTEYESQTTGESKGTSQQQSRSLMIEHQNGIALELEKIADQYLERMIRGFGSGYWETSITFATRDKISSAILAGTFAGELSKPSDKLLPPPRVYLDTLNDKALFIPKANSTNTLFPKSLASYITSEELSLVSSPPVESVPGYEIQIMPALALTDTGSKSAMVLGSVADHGNPIPDTFLYLSKNDLNKHIFVCGLTGSGKTTTVKHILKNLVEKEVTPFLVIESAKRDYRQLLSNDAFKGNLNIFTIANANVSPVRFNPFYIQENVHPLEHIDYLKAIFNASFSLYGPMPSIVEKCLHTIYIKKGWDLTLGIHPNFLDENGNYDGERYRTEEHYYCFPTLADLKNEIDRYVQSDLNYKGELSDNIRTAIVVRLESLCLGAKGLMFNTHDFFSIDDLLSKNTILEMESLTDDDDKAFFVGLILVLISEYRQKENPAVNPGIGNKGLRHFLVIEEAHRLLKNIQTERTSEMMGNPKGKAVEVFCNILAEMRALGQGVAVVEQIPSKISPDVIKNSNTKIVHRLVSKDDQSLLAGSLSIDDDDALYLNRLKVGHALCHKEGMGRPVECAVFNDVNFHAISDEKVKRSMTSLLANTLHSYQAYQIDACLGDAGKELVVRFFNSLVTVQFGEIDSLVSMANEELEKLLASRNFQNPIYISFFSDYLCLQIMELLTRGIYSRRNPFPNNSKLTICDVIKEPSGKGHIQLLDHLDALWRPFTARRYIEEVVENLTVHYLSNNNLEVELSVIEKTVSSFLLFNDKDVTGNFAQRILKITESAHD